MVHTTGGSEKADGGKHPRARSGVEYDTHDTHSLYSGEKHIYTSTLTSQVSRGFVLDICFFAVSLLVFVFQSVLQKQRDT